MFQNWWLFPARSPNTRSHGPPWECGPGRSRVRISPRADDAERGNECFSSYPPVRGHEPGSFRRGDWVRSGRLGCRYSLPMGSFRECDWVRFGNLKAVTFCHWVRFAGSALYRRQHRNTFSRSFLILPRRNTARTPNILSKRFGYPSRESRRSGRRLRVGLHQPLA